MKHLRQIACFSLILLLTAASAAPLYAADPKAGIRAGAEGCIKQINKLENNTSNSEDPTLELEGELTHINGYAGGELYKYSPETDSYYLIQSDNFRITDGSSHFRLRFGYGEGTVLDGMYLILLTDYENAVNGLDIQTVPEDGSSGSYSIFVEAAGGELRPDALSISLGAPTGEPNSSQGQNQSQDQNNPVKLNDLQGHWAEASMRSLLEKGYIRGYVDGSMHPDDYITRAEFCQMVKNVFGYESPRRTERFSDVRRGSWYFNAVTDLNNAGLVSGFSTKLFGPEDLITREQMITILDKAARQRKIYEEGLTGNATASFSDAESIEPYAREHVSAMLAAGLISGVRDEKTGLNYFLPASNATRAEAATVIDTLLKRTDGGA